MIMEINETHMTLLEVVVIIIVKEQIHLLVPSRDAGIEKSNSFFFFCFAISSDLGADKNRDLCGR
jgi:hypothetical protein